MHDQAQSPKPILWLVIPCFNEEEVLPITAPLFLEKITKLADAGRISQKSRVVFVDDGSSDSTWSIIQQLSNQDERFGGLRLSRNRGHQNALLCGLMEARRYCDAAISVDCDGQDDINAIDQMVEHFLAGDDIVFGVRSDRSTDSAFKRGSAQAFYKLMGRFGTETIYNHADYRLLSAQALEALAEFGEVNLFLRGMVLQLGFPYSVVTYERHERIAGQSHYPLKKMLALAIDGITSLSIVPIRLVSMIGLIFSILGFVGVIWALVSFALGSAIVGWSSTIVLISLIGGIQLLSLGVIGEYVGKTYLESKARPRYIVADRTWQPHHRVYKG